MSDLILKNDDAFRVACRHFIHTINSHFTAADKRLAAIRDDAAATDGVAQAVLDTAYPEDLFTRYTGSVDAVEDEADRIAAAGESYTGMARDIEIQFIRTIMRIGGDIEDSLGTSPVMDREIAVLYDALFDLIDVSAFVESSISRRTKRCQDLLDSPSPTQFASILGVGFTQKASIAEAVRRCAPRFDAAVEDGTLASMNINDMVESTVGEVLDDDLFTEAEDRILTAFEDNEARNQVLSTVANDVYNTLMAKMCPAVFETVAEEYGLDSV